MARWTVEQARAWHAAHPWLVGCNFLPSTAINQLEMFQADTFDRATIVREVGLAESLGFNVLRIYLHDLLWHHDRAGFITRINDVLAIADQHGMKVVLTLFDDCHRPDPVIGPQPLPVWGVHNSGWKQSPGKLLVEQIAASAAPAAELARLERYVREVLATFSGDPRVLMWDLYNEPGQSGYGDASLALLKLTWEWASAVRPSQPLTSCLDGSIGEQNIAVNAALSDIITFHCYDGPSLAKVIQRVRDVAAGRPIMCTEYMAREQGSTFQHCMPIFKEYRVGCINWGLVQGKSQTHLNWQTAKHLEERRAAGRFVRPGETYPEPELWFHEIFRTNGTPYRAEEVAFIRQMTGRI